MISIWMSWIMSNIDHKSKYLFASRLKPNFLNFLFTLRTIWLFLCKFLCISTVFQFFRYFKWSKETSYILFTPYEQICYSNKSNKYNLRYSGDELCWKPYMRWNWRIFKLDNKLKAISFRFEIYSKRLRNRIDFIIWTLLSIKF